MSGSSIMETPTPEGAVNRYILLPSGRTHLPDVTKGNNKFGACFQKTPPTTYYLPR